MDGGIDPLGSAVRVISNYTIVHWIYDHCLDPDTDHKCANFGTNIRSLARAIESLDRIFEGDRTDSDGHPFLSNQVADYRAAKLNFVALLTECEQLFLSNAKFRYGKANVLQGVVLPAKTQAKANELLERISLQTQRATYIHSRLIYEGQCNMASQLNSVVQNIHPPTSYRADDVPRNFIQPLENKQMSILLASPPGLQDCRLLVIRDLSHQPGTPVQVERQWKQNGTLYSKSCSIDVRTDILKPLYAVEKRLHQHLSIEICSFEGKRRELYEFADLSETFKFQRALTNYNVFSDFEDVYWTFLHTFSSSFCGKSSRVQIWCFDPQDSLEKAAAEIIATTSRNPGQDSILSRLTSSSGHSLLSKLGPSKSASLSLYPAMLSKSAVTDDNSPSNALIVVYVMGKNGLEYLCIQLHIQMYIDNTACNCKRHPEKCTQSVIRSGKSDMCEIKRIQVRPAEQHANLNVFACLYGQQLSSSPLWQTAQSLTARELVLDFANAQQRRRFNQQLIFVLKLLRSQSEAESLLEMRAKYQKNKPKGTEAKERIQGDYRGDNTEAAVRKPDHVFDSQRHVFDSSAFQRSGISPSSDIAPRSEGYKQSYSLLASSEQHQLEEVQQSGNERLSSEERLLKEERQRQLMQQQKEKGELEKQGGIKEKQEPMDDHVSETPTVDQLQRFLRICVPRARAFYTWWHGFVTLQSVRGTRRVHSLKTIGFPGNQVGVPHTGTPKSSSTAENRPSSTTINTSSTSNESSSNSVGPKVTTSNQSSLTASLPPTCLTLHAIYVDRKFGHFQNPIEVGHFTNDRDLFCHLNEVYRGYRRSWRAVTKLKSLRLTKFVMTDEYYVDVLYDESNLCDMMPNPRDPNYTFSWLPVGPMPMPIISQSTLWRKFCDPNGKESSGGINDGECLRRLPKRHRPLSFTSNEGYPIGWGLEFVEGWNWTFLFVCESFIAVATMIFSVLWATLSSRDDRVAVAFSIGQWMFGVGQVLYILIVLASEYFMAWRY